MNRRCHAAPPWLRRDPVWPAPPSASARAKKRQRHTPEGWPVHSFETLLAHLATPTHNTCQLRRQGPKGFADVTVEASPSRPRCSRGRRNSWSCSQ